MLKDLITRYPRLSVCEPEIRKTADLLIACYTAGGKVLTCGNGGSCADADHIVGELMKGFLKKRRLSDSQKQAMQSRCPELDSDVLNKLQQGLPALSLCTLTALNTAFCNDVDPELVYAQGILSLGKPEDMVICISTTGNAQNVLAAARIAKAMGLTVIGLTGAHGGSLRKIVNVCICVPETETYKIQELHLPVYHTLCATTEERFFRNNY